MKGTRDIQASVYPEVFSADQLTVDEAFGQTMSFIDDVKTAEKHLRSMYVRLARKMVACERDLRPGDRRAYLALCERAVPSSTSLNRAINSERRLFAMKENGNNDALLVKEILKMHEERPSRLDECSARLLGEDGAIKDADLAKRYLNRSINAAGLRPSEDEGGLRLRVPKQYRKDVAHVRFEEWAGDLLKKIYPKYRWRHEGRFHKSERGLDWLGRGSETIENFLIHFVAL